MSALLVGSIEEDLTACRAAFEDRTFQAVGEWKSARPGAKAIGCYPVHAPFELIHAHGMLPAAVLGGGNHIEIAHADARFQSFICSIVKSTLELGLVGNLDVFDGMIFSSICDPARNLASVFRRNFPHLVTEYIHFPQNLGSPHALIYLRDEYRRVAATLASLGGREASDDDLWASIAMYDQWRAAVRALYHLRATAPHLVTTSEAYALVRAGTVWPPEIHLPVLERALAALTTRAARPKDRIRVVVEGSFCEQPPLDLIACLEEAGCYILDDDFLAGWRWYTGDVATGGGDPYEALARAYIDRSVYCATKHDLREPKAAHLVRRVRQTGAQAVIFLCAKFCEPALFDYAIYRPGLEAAGIPHLLLEFEEKAWIFDRARTEVETFVESMLFD